MPSSLCPWNFFSNTQGLRLYIKVKDICSQTYNKPRYRCEGFSGAFGNLEKSDYNIRYVCPSVSSKQLDSHSTDFHEIRYLRIFKKIHRENSSLIKNEKNNGTLHEDLCTFVIISHSVLLRMRNVSNKSYTENQNINFVLCLLDRTSS